MVEGKWFPPGAPFPEAESIRKAVFHRGVDALDAISWNVLVWHDQQPAATGRLWWQDGAFWLGDVAVLPAFRGKGLGDLTLRLILFKAQTHAARFIRTKTPDETMGFFTRLGFQQECTDAQGMQQMLLMGEALRLDHCQGCTQCASVTSSEGCCCATAETDAESGRSSQS